MVTRKQTCESDAKAAKIASVQRLLILLEEAYRSGRLKPINPEARSVTFEIRVKS